MLDPSTVPITFDAPEPISVPPALDPVDFARAGFVDAAPTDSGFTRADLVAVVVSVAAFVVAFSVFAFASSGFAPV